MRIETLRADIDDLLRRLESHPLYSCLERASDLRVFMESHVFCVWDFMTLLMALRRRLCGDSIPWVPVGLAEDRRLINEIVLDEESDRAPEGRPISHFELYLEAMREVGADTGSIDHFVAALRAEVPVRRALDLCQAPTGVPAFIAHTLEVAQSAPLHVLAAVFFSSREALIPPIFGRIVERIAPALPAHPDGFRAVAAEPEMRRAAPVAGSWGLLRFYLERHIEVDDGEHQHAAGLIVARACGSEGERWQRATLASRAALEARIELWDQIRAQIEKQHASPE